MTDGLDRCKFCDKDGMPRWNEPTTAVSRFCYLCKREEFRKDRKEGVGNAESREG